MSLDLTFIGWIHSIFCVFALVLGPMALLRQKGGAAHARFGNMYLVAMLAVNVTALCIYRRHMFWFPHWFAVANLVCMGIAYAAVRFKRPRRAWIHFHLTAMLATYYDLVGGGVNEAYLRVAPLRRLDDASQGAAIGFTHLAVEVFFVVVIVAVNVAVRRGRRQLVGLAPTPRLA